MSAVKVAVPWPIRLAACLLFAVASLLAFSLMLVVMAFEVGVLFSAALGLASGSFLFNLIVIPQTNDASITIVKQGNYEPNPDPCCNKVDLVPAAEEKRAEGDD